VASRGGRLAWLGVLGLWLALTLPLALGQRTFYFRDVFKTHLPIKAFGAVELRSGRVPALNPTLGLGQPFRGNPNALAFYPGNLLYLALPFFSAFNLHYALHWLLALLGAWALARTLGQSPAAALVAALAFAGGGWMLSALTFYNLLAVAAWWPWVLAGARRGGVRGTALGGLACGMALLAGEPVTAALGLLPLVVVAAGAHRAAAWRVLAGVLGTGIAVALPQVVATLRVLPFTVRGRGELDLAAAGYFSFHPLRLAELVVPFPFGLPGSFGADRYWTGAWGDTVPFVLTLFAGAPALWLALRGARGRPGWAALAVIGAVVSCAPAGLAGVAARLSGGLMRHPEKALFWTALALALLAGWGLDRTLAAAGPRFRGAAALAAAGLGLGLLGGLVAPDLARAVGERLAARGLPPVQVASAVKGSEAHWELRARGLATSAGCLALAVMAARRRRPHLVAGCQLLSLLALHPLWMTEPVGPYTRPPLAGAPATGGAVVIASLPDPPWERLPVPALASRGLIARWLAGQLYPAAGVLHGLSYPLPPDVDGMVSPLLSATEARLGRASWSERVAWSRRLGAWGLVAFAELPGLRRAEPAGIAPGAPSPSLYLLGAPAPPARWPSRVVVARAGEERLLLRGLGTESALVRRPVIHRAGGRLRWLGSSADRVELEVESGGGLVVVRRAFQQVWRARTAGGRPLPVLPVDGLLLGIEVPAGRVRVEAAVSAWPETLAGVVALLAAAGALSLALRPRPGAPPPSAPASPTPG
jgi:hypothetical protein